MPEPSFGYGKGLIEMTEEDGASVGHSYSFGPFVLVPGQQLLTKDQTTVRIGSRAFEILVALVERPGELVRKSELLSRVWSDTFVEEGNIKVNVAALRRALGDGRGGKRYIANVAGRGYRFVSPVQVLNQGHGGHHDPALPLARPHNLPLSSMRTIGRADAVDAIFHAFEVSRLITIVGAGGIGKTTAALAVADRLTADCEHGVWFVDLSSLDDPALVSASIAATIGLNVHSANVEAALVAFLRDRKLVLVLDNCEQLVDAVCSCAETLLAAAARVRVLATSREPLGTRGERVYRLPPLEAPPRQAGLTAAEALTFPAVELFVERAAGSLGNFVLSDEDAPAVAEICRRLDGLALAIELAATRADAFGMNEILDLLDDRFQLLKSRRIGRGRHQTLGAMLDWSYNLLTGRQRTILRRLSVFTGAFSLESACALGGDEGRDRAERIDDIASLVAKSLVSAERGNAGTHYRLLDTTRRYALQKLAESGELDRLRQRHAEHLLELAERAEAEWKTRPTVEWLTTYGRKVDDIRSALNWAFTDNRSLSIGTALTAAAIPFWEHLSLVEECRVSVERALDDTAAQFRSDRDDMKLYMALGTTLLHTRGPLAAVKTAWTKALELAERLHDTEYELRCLWGLCDYHTWTGDHRSALAIADRIGRLAADRGDQVACNNVHRQAGTALRYLGELAEARRHLERMIGRYIPPVVRSDVARFQLDPRSAARGTLANVLWLQGYPDQAAALAWRQLEEARAAEHAMALCNALVHTACPIALLTGDLAAAEHLLAGIENHVAQHAMPVWSAMALCLRGEWLLKRGDPSGLTVLRRALDALSGVGFRMRYPSHLGAYAAGLGAHGEVAAGHAAIDEAIALASGEVWCMPELLRIKGDLLRLERPGGKADAAEEYYVQALDWAHRQGALSWELRAATSLAEIWCQSDSERAENLLVSTYRRFDEGFRTGDLTRARSLLNAIRKAGDTKAATLSTYRAPFAATR